MTGHSRPTPDLDDAALARRIAAAARRHGGPWGATTATDGVVGLRRLPGGVSSLTYAAEIRVEGAAGGGGGEAGHPVVIKVAPPGLEPVRNRDVLRQSRLMAAVRSSGALPVPRILLEDSGDPPSVPPLFVMDLVPGQSYEPRLDVAEDPPSAAVVRDRSLAAATSLAALQGLDPGLAGAREPVLELRAELERWERLLQTVSEDLVPGHGQLYRRLAAAVPEDAAPVIVHGDYRQANMLFDGPRLAAVIDWEIWSIGDPRLDLAWLLMHTDPAHRYARTRSVPDREAGTGMPTRAELLAAYHGAGGPAPAEDLPWFLAYSYYKVASTLGVIVKRHRKAVREGTEDPAEHLLAAQESLPDVVAHGLAALDAA